MRVWYNERMTNTNDYDMTFEQFSEALSRRGIPQDRHEEYFEDGFSISDAWDDWEWQKQVDEYAQALADRNSAILAQTWDETAHIRAAQA